MCGNGKERGNVLHHLLDDMSGPEVLKVAPTVLQHQWKQVGKLVFDKKEMRAASAITSPNSPSTVQGEESFADIDQLNWQTSSSTNEESSPPGQEVEDIQEQKEVSDDNDLEVGGEPGNNDQASGHENDPGPDDNILEAGNKPFTGATGDSCES